MLVDAIGARHAGAHQHDACPRWLEDALDGDVRVGCRLSAALIACTWRRRLEQRRWFGVPEEPGGEVACHPDSTTLTELA